MHCQRQSASPAPSARVLSGLLPLRRTSPGLPHPCPAVWTLDAHSSHNLCSAGGTVSPPQSTARSYGALNMCEMACSPSVWLTGEGLFGDGHGAESHPSRGGSALVSSSVGGGAAALWGALLSWQWAEVQGQQKPVIPLPGAIWTWHTFTSAHLLVRARSNLLVRPSPKLTGRQAHSTHWTARAGHRMLRDGAECWNSSLQ